MNQLLQVFPYHLGPSIRKFGTALLYKGKLSVSLPGWLQEEVMHSFFDLLDRARAKDHILLATSRLVAHHLALAQKQAMAETKILKPLGDRILKVIMVYPGTPVHYNRWQPLQERAFPILLSALDHVQIMNVAATEFVWRVYELFLIEDGDLDKVLSVLSQRAEFFSDPRLILVECLLNRFSIAGSHMSKEHDVISNVTDNPAFVEVPTLWSEGLEHTRDQTPARVEALAFTVFDQLLASHVPLLVGEKVAKIASLMESRTQELDALREKCWQEAAALVHEAPIESQLKNALKHSLSRMTSELQSVLDIKSRSVKKLIQSLMEDDALWVLSGGIIGSVSLGAPDVVTAAMAMTAFSKLGTKALKARREEKELLSSSPWSFVYYLSRKQSRAQPSQCT